MFQIKQSEATAARRRIPVLFVSSTDGFTPTTPTSPAAYISTNGGTFVATTNAVTLETLAAGQSASGCYYLELTATEVATLGVINVNVQSTNCRQYNAVIQVMAYDAYDVVRIGLTALPNAVAGASGGLPTGNASGQVTVAGTAAGAITASSFTAGAIDANAIATDAITSAELSATAVTEIAAGVWDEAYASHTAAGTFGKLMDLLRKANNATEYTIAASGTPANSTVYFRSNATGGILVDNFFNNQTILFTSGNLAGQSGHVTSYQSTNGVFQLDDGLTSTPNAGDTFLVMGDHSWTQAQIADGVMTRSLALAGAANNINITSIVANVFQASNTLAVDDRVAFIGTAPNNFVLGAIYWVTSTSLTSSTFTLSTTQGGLPSSTTSTGAFTASKVTGRDLLSALRYLRNKVDISGSTMTVYQEDDTAAAWTAALTATAGVNPITTVDPV